MRNSTIALAICASTSTFLFGSQVSAQSAPAEQELTEVVITGSRIVRNGNNAPTPVTVANVEQLAVATPTNIPDALNKLPAFSSSRSAATLGNGANPNQGNYLNLRAFGFNRTLILMDGRRVPGTTFTGDINTDTLPQMLVQRVDVVTGGASAVYGSDAVTGVVNYILNKEFVGLKAVAQYGISSRSDDNSWRLGVAGGAQVGERGHAIFSIEHFDRKGIESKYDRPLGRAIWQEVGGGTAANPYRQIENGRLNTTSFGGRIIQTGTAAGQLLPASLLNTQFLPGGVLAPYDIGVAGVTGNGTVGMSSGGDGGYVNGNAATAPLETTQAFARYQLELTDSTTAFVQGNWSQSENSYHGQNEFRPYASPNAINIYTGNAYLPANVQSIMTTNAVTQFGLGRYNDDFGNLILLDAVNKSFMLTAGVEGEIGDNWNWDAFYTRGEGSVRLDSFDNVNNGRFYAAIDAVRDSNNNIVCRVTVTNPGLYPGCVPMNIFGDKSPSQASIDYITGDTWWDAKNTLDDFGVNFTGTLGRTWAGPISVATGAEYRKNKLVMHTSDDPRTPVNATGLRIPAINTSNGVLGTQNWTRNVVAPTNADSNVFEANVEAVLPLLTDVAFAKVLELNGAVRYTDYSTTGKENTWKVGVNWQPFDDLRVRGTRSRDIRAPSLFELYQAESLSITGFTDSLHTGVGGSTNTSTKGNPDLVPEVANTLTVGLVYSPSFVPGLSISVDYYDITIDNAIASVGGNNASVLKLCEDSGGTSPLCSLYVRPLPFSDRSPANYPTLIKSQNLNIAETSTHGVDVEINYNTNLGAGNLDLRLLAAFQPVLYQRTLPGTTLLDLAGAASVGPGSVALQEKRYTLNATYKLDKLAMNTQIRYLSSLLPNPDPTLVYAPGQGIPAYMYVDFAATYDIESGGMTFTPFLSINNVMDKDPPLHASTAFTGNPGFFYPVPTGYDIVGRYYTAGVRFKF